LFVLVVLSDLIFGDIHVVILMSWCLSLLQSNIWWKKYFM